MSNKVRSTTLLLLGAASLSACIPLAPKEDTQESDIPELTMKLPGTLSGVVARPLSKVGARSSNIDDCSAYFDATAKPNTNGYEMSRYLVGLSQSQSCVADFIMRTVVGTASILANKGIQSIPLVNNPGEDPSHFEVVKINDTYHVWLYFGQPNVSLDTSAVKTMYITWTKTPETNDVVGQFFFVRLGGTTGSDQPGNLRVDFTRTATLNQNDIFLDFADPATAGQNGFRIQVQENIGDETTYITKGLLQFSGQPADNLPTTETYNLPTLDVVSVTKATGEGAAIWHINDLDFHIGATGIDDGNGSTYDLNVGTYGIQLEDESFFTATAAIEWQYREFSEAHYINTSRTNTRLNANTILNCMESTGTNDCGIGVHALGLGSNYFAGTCTDADGADCSAMMAGYYEQGALDAIFGAVTNSALADKPDDWRATAFTGQVALDSLYPAGQTKDTVFVMANDKDSI